MKDFTDLSDSSLSDTIKKLKERNLLITSKNRSKQHITYKINSKISTWKTLRKTEVLRKTGVNTSKNRSIPYKDNIKIVKVKLEKNNGKKSQFPTDFKLTPELKKYAVAKGIIEHYTDEVFEEFENHHRGKGTVMKDWDRAWYTWVQKAINFNSPYAKDRELTE